jgi:hypothetical protein
MYISVPAVLRGFVHFSVMHNNIFKKCVGGHAADINRIYGMNNIFFLYDP